MGVIVYAQDLSGRKDDGYYTKSNISSALDIFFNSEYPENFLDADGEKNLTRDEAEEIFQQEKRITFYNEAGEKVVISFDPCA